MKHARPQAAVSILAAASIACGAARSAPQVPQDEGPSLTPAGEVVKSSGEVRLVWSADGTELFYTTPADVKSVRLSDGFIRTLAAVNGFLDLELAPGGVALYVVSVPASGPPDVLVDLFSGHRFPDLPVGYGIPHNVMQVAVSPDGRRIAFELDAGIGLYDLASGAVVSVPGCAPALDFDPPPAVFSPTGAEILCRNPSGGPTGALIVELASGSARAVEAGGYVRWGSDGLRTFEGCAPSGRPMFCVRDVDAGSTRGLYAVDPMFLPGGAAWSPDGRAIALWELARCDDSPSFICWPVRARLQIIDVTSGNATVLASGTDIPGAMAFSPDSGRVAYVFGTMIHARSVR